MTRSRAGACVSLMVGGGLLAATEAAARPVNVVRTEFVSPVAGDPVASGARLLRAMADIAAPSATNPWLVKLEPGIYDLNGESLGLRPFVDLEGSGEGVTTVRSTVNGLGTIRGADDAELRRLTVLNTASTLAVGLRNAAPRFAASHVTCIAQGGSSHSTALSSFAAGGAFRDMTVRAEGSPNTTGVNFDGGLLLRARVFASGSDFAYGVFSHGSTGEIIDVTAEVESPSYATAFRNEAGGPLMRNVRAIARGADISEGIVNGGGAATRIRGAVVEVTGGIDFSTGIRNEFSSASVSDATIAVEGKEAAFGVASAFGGTPSLRNVTMRVTTGTGHGVGVRSDGTQVTVEGSTISAGWRSLHNGFTDPTSSISVGASRLEGGVEPGAGTVRCVFTYDQAYAPLGANCLP